MDMSTQKELLQERYEIRGDEADFIAAKALYEEALAAQEPTAEVLRQYGFLLNCHGRNELRRAVEQYRRALELDPDADKTRYMLISTLAALFDTDEMIELYKQRVAAAPQDVRNYRFLAHAYLAVHDCLQAGRVVDSGLELAPADRVLIEARGEVKAGSGDIDGALADWRDAVEPADDDFGIGPLYSSAFLLEREGRLNEALAMWQSIVNWNERRGIELEAEYPKGELQRVQRVLLGS